MTHQYQWYRDIKTTFTLQHFELLCSQSGENQKKKVRKVITIELISFSFQWLALPWFAERACRDIARLHLLQRKADVCRYSVTWKLDKIWLDWCQIGAVLQTIRQVSDLGPHMKWPGSDLNTWICYVCMVSWVPINKWEPSLWITPPLSPRPSTPVCSLSLHSLPLSPSHSLIFTPHAVMNGIMNIMW